MKALAIFAVSILAVWWAVRGVQVILDNPSNPQSYGYALIVWAFFLAVAWGWWELLRPKK
jgi:hypothetical protein